MSKDSLKKRYFYKLFTNTFGFTIAFVTSAIVPRSLGPKAYGDFNFLTNFFNQLVSFFDMGSSSCFYTKLSQKPKESKLVSFYFYFMGITMLLVIAFVVMAHSTGIYIKLWPDQRMFYVYLAILLGIFTWITKVVSYMADAYGLTVSAEVGKIFQKIVGLLIIIFLFICHRLNLIAFFLYNYFIFFLLIIVFIRIIKRNSYSIERENWKLTHIETTGYAKEFYRYSCPLFVYSLMGMLMSLFDRWLLQVFGGSLQQGFFGFADQISIVCILFTSAMTPLIMREFAISYNNKDFKLMATAFRKHIPLLYSIAAILACFIAVNADKITSLWGGIKFKEAALVVTIMAFFPVQQTYAQLSGSVFYATGQTKLYRNISIFFILIGFPLAYFLIAPERLFGMNLGASGLAIKIVALQFCIINVQLYFNARLLKLSFFKYFTHQLINLIIFSSVAIFAAFLANYILIFYKNPIFNFIISGLVYTLLVFILIYFLPIIIGLKRKELQSYLQLIKIQF